MLNKDQEAMRMIGKLMHLQHLLRIHRMETVQGGNGMDATRGRGRVLAVLNSVGEISPGDLAFVLQIRLQSMNESLKKLEEAGLIEKRQDETDKRRTLISLTEEGKKEVPPAPGSLAVIFDTLSEDEKKQFSEYLDRITAALARELNLPEKEDEQMQAMKERMGDERFAKMMGMRMGMGRPFSGEKPPFMDKEEKL